MDFIWSHDFRMADLFDESAHFQGIITNFGDGESKARVVYRIPKKLVVHADAKHLIVHVAGDNVYEAWRQQHSKVEPPERRSGGTHRESHHEGVEAEVRAHLRRAGHARTLGRLPT